MQDSFVAMHGAWRRLRDSDKALSYLRQSVVNRSRSVLRHRLVVGRNTLEPLPDMPSAEHGAILLLERLEVVAALRRLPVRQREALVLRFYRDLTESQVALVMGISRGAVKITRPAPWQRCGPSWSSTHEEGQEGGQGAWAGRMTRDDRDYDAIIRRALQAAAESVEPAGDGLERIRHRLASPPELHSPGVCIRGVVPASCDQAARPPGTRRDLAAAGSRHCRRRGHRGRGCLGPRPGTAIRHAGQLGRKPWPELPAVQRPLLRPSRDRGLGPAHRVEPNPTTGRSGSGGVAVLPVIPRTPAPTTTPTPTSSPSKSATPSPTPTPTPTPAPAPTPTPDTPTPTPTPTHTHTSTPTPTPTPTPTDTSSPAPQPTPARPR